MEEIIDQLEEYFKNSKQAFSIGLQNFQGVREYTTIPLAPLTLVYGQNSAGKSTINDAQQFIYGFFSGNWDSKTTAEYLERWANHNRFTKPLVKGYLGKPDDVVLTVSSTTDDQDYLEWEAFYHLNQDFVEQGLAHTLFGPVMDGPIPFRIDIHFSNTVNAWSVRQFSLYLGDDICLELILDDFQTDSESLDEYGLLKLNKQHLVYSLLDAVFVDGMEQFTTNYHPQEGSGMDEKWFLFDELDINCELGWKKPIAWFEVDCQAERPSTEVLELRTFFLSLMQVPTKGISRNFNFNSIPPLRPIPTKENAVFRFHINNDEKRLGWSAIAEQICLKELDEHNSAAQLDISGSAFENLDTINRFLSHPMFLNTEYEVTGECRFLAPIQALKKGDQSDGEIYEGIRGLEVEVHLKLKNKSTGCLIEIEDVGVGISQIVPVLIAITMSDDFNNSYRAFIQQPELHLHPKLQAQLADAFIECINRHMVLGGFPSFIIESHSEHFLLRLLRRIRETSKSDIKNKLFSFDPENLSVLYVDKLEDGSSKIFPLRVSPDGEFIDRWPHGFFTERDGDLFDE